MQEERLQNRENSGAEEDNAGSFLLGSAGAVIGLVTGFFLFVATYKPFTGLGGTPVWQVCLMDGLIIMVVGALAFVFRRKTAFLQGILISAALLFVLNGFCGLSGR